MAHEHDIRGGTRSVLVLVLVDTTSSRMNRSMGLGWPRDKHFPLEPSSLVYSSSPPLDLSAGRVSSRCLVVQQKQLGGCELMSIDVN